jgi:hypothetical protein
MSVAPRAGLGLGAVGVAWEGGGAGVSDGPGLETAILYSAWAAFGQGGIDQGGG